MMLAEALTRFDIARYVNALFEVYIILIFVYILLNLLFSFGVRLPYARWSDVVLKRSTRPLMAMLIRPVGR